LQIFVIISWILALKVIGIFLHRSMKKNACDVLAGTIKRLAATASIQCVSEAIIDSVYKLLSGLRKIFRKLVLDKPQMTNMNQQRKNIAHGLKA
jgi:hypothetical protein